MNSNKLKGVIIYLVIIFLLIFGLVSVLNIASNSSRTTVTYSGVISEFDDLNVAQYQLDLGSGALTYKLKGEAASAPAHQYTVPNVSIFINDINSGYTSDGKAANYRLRYNEANPDSPLVEDYIPISDNTFLTSVLPYLLLVGVMIIFTVIVMRQSTGGGKMSSFSKANVRQNTGKKVTFDDVAGADEEKQELEEIVDFLKNPGKYREIGARVPKGVLLVGPPGTGKTLLAKAVAGEAHVPFYSLSGSDFVEMFVGVGASRVRDLFKQAQQSAPCIIFIDEIDAIGRSRDSRMGGNDEREQTLNQLLSEMDGFDSSKGLLVLGATNRPEILDPALLRPGRFDRRVIVDKPDLKGRVNILKVHSKDVRLDETVDFEEIALATSGAVGADHYAGRGVLKNGRKGQRPFLPFFYVLSAG